MTYSYQPLSYGYTPYEPGSTADDTGISALNPMLSEFGSLASLYGSAADLGALGLTAGGDALMGGIGAASGLLPTLGAIGAAAGPAALSLPTLMPIFMDLAFGDPTGKKAMQQQEYIDALNTFKSGVAARKLGAGLLPNLGHISSDTDIGHAYDLASLGLEPNLSHAADLVTHGSRYAKGHPELTADYLQQAPKLETENWQAYLDLMDAAAKRNLDVIPDQPGMDSPLYASHSQLMGSVWEPNKYQAPQSPLNPYDPNAAIGSAMRYFNLPGANQQGSGGTLTQHVLGDDSHGYVDQTMHTFTPEQLTQMGFTPGHYRDAMNTYLTGLDPTLSNRPEYQQWYNAQVADPTGLTADQITQNEAGFGQQMTDWQAQLKQQQDEWYQNWQRQAAEAQQRWTSGGG